MSKKTYTFNLLGVDINKVEKKYGITSVIYNDEIPENTTTIDDLDIIKKIPTTISFLDESKRLRKCSVSMIDFNSGKKLEKGIRYKCFWDKDFIPDNIQPIGCPIKYIPSKALKSYYSEISKETYTIVENITDKKAKLLEENEDQRIKIEKKSYYQTDGIFCSFNCCMAYIRAPENKNNSMYKNSESLLLKMYSEFSDQNNNLDIVPASHWKTLIPFGGHLTIEKFRESFNKINYVNHGLICMSVGYLFEDQIKF